LRSAALVLACAALASLAAAPAGAQAQRPANRPPAAAAAVPPPCEVAAERAALSAPLLRTARKLADGAPITIVALGSSSTYGYGASTPDASYPSRLAQELALRLPGRQIRVLNRGLNNDEVNETLARLDRDVIAEQPDLVLWQVGTNALLRNTPLRTEALQQGLARMKAIGADVVLIDPQFAPRVLAAQNAERMVSLIAATAMAEHVGLFRRYDLMRHWHETERLPLQTFLTFDGLHMNDWSYACLGKWIGAAIAQAATLPAFAQAPATP
jgi:lysophospholipase L1-like esterase